jgi:adenine/guanine phosphoribosyltransferase-like PRPP-binding protein
MTSYNDIGDSQLLNDNYELASDILIAGFDEKIEQWKVSLAWAKRPDLWANCACALASASSSADYIFAIRTSGIALAVLMHAVTGKPLVWGTHPSIDFVYPKYESLSGKKLFLVDSHIITGGNLLRHATMLESIGAKIEGAGIIFDVDGLESSDYRDPSCATLLLQVVPKIRPLWIWSALAPILRESGHNSLLLDIINLAYQKGLHFWR